MAMISRARASVLVLCKIMAIARLSTTVTMLSRRVGALTHHHAHHCRRPVNAISFLRTPFRRNVPNCMLFSSVDNVHDRKRQRLQALHQELTTLNIDANALQDANLQAVENPINGYDGRYGRSAIRAYRSFVEPKSDESPSSASVQVLAARCARQIDFLIKRHKSHEAEWVRHTDTATEERQVFPLVLLLDNVRSAFNVGSLFRTADACGCSLVVTTGITSHPTGSGAEKLTKSALGADRLVPSRHYETTLQAIEALRDKYPQYKLIGMETTERSIIYTSYDYPREGAILVLGNEVTGVDTEILPLLDDVIQIPMYGAKNSLNIAASAPVVLYEILRQWGVSEKR